MRFRIGDKVRVNPLTADFSADLDSLNLVGEVVSLRDNGRMDVKFNGRDLIEENSQSEFLLA